MASLLATRRSALNGLALVSIPGVVEMADAGAAARFIYRGSAAALGAAIGVQDVATPCRATVGEGITALWFGPDEWLLLCPPDQVAALRAGMTPALNAASGCLVDIGDRNFALGLAGPRAADLLASACPLDFDLSAFPAGMCARTIFGKAEVIVWRSAPQSFRVEAWRSFAPYLVDLVNVAVRGLK